LRFLPLLALLGAAALPPAASAQTTPDPSAETPAQKAERMAWFQDARFGMFIHWGLYAIPAGEYQGKTHYGEWFLEETKMPVSQYEQFARQFNPLKFDARAWVKMARNAGMKYIVITSKHHDGFALYPSALTDWCIKSTPFQRDPLKELAEACQAEGIRLCFYHSIMDWHHPDWGTRRPWNDRAAGTPDMDRYVAFMKGQLRELLTNYGPIGILWFDGEWESPWTTPRGKDLYAFVRSLQPKIIINNRVGKGRAGMKGMDKGEGVGDYGTPEQEIPPTGFGPGVAWESCMTMNDHWGYNKHDNNWKSPQTLIRNLIDCASKGGNYLLNVGPTAEGEFPPEAIDRLNAIAAWMKLNSTAIHGSSASPFPAPLPWGRCTQKPSGDITTLYLHIFDWPRDGKIRLPGLTSQVRQARLLATDQPLETRPDPAGLVVALPADAVDPIAAVVELQLRGPVRITSP
jgi:alpha-L-fucosidase